MANKNFKTLKELEAYILSQTLGALKETAEVVKDVQSEKVQTEVYDEYSPKYSSNGEPYVYERRKKQGGLQDKRNMVTENVVVNGNKASVDIRNTTKGKEDNFEIADLVEYGDGYGGKEYRYKTNRSGDPTYLDSRPFTKETVIELENTGQHIGKFISEMKKRGIDIGK